MSRIETQVWTPITQDEEGHTGYIRYRSQVQTDEVTEQIRAALERIRTPDGCTAADQMEWINGPHTGWNEDAPTDYPKGETLCSVAKGANEGYHVLIMVRAPTGDAQTLYTIKYLTGQAEAWNIAQQLYNAFEIY